MSRTEELHKLAELFHAQAEATLNATAKQALHKMGDNYQREARQSEREVLDEAKA
jgi:hypothetical protein